MRGWLKPTLLLALLLNFFAPATAHANKWLSWLEELSGPGDFQGAVRAGIEVACVGSPVSKQATLALLGFTHVELTGDAKKASATFDGIVAAVRMSEGRSDDDRLVDLLEKLEARKREHPDYTEEQLVELWWGARRNRMATTVDDARVQAALVELLKTLNQDNVLASRFWPAYEENQRKFRRCRVDRSNNLVSVQVEMASLKDNADGRPTRYNGFTRATTIAAIAYVPIGRLNFKLAEDVPSWGRFVELGVGVGAFGFTGSTLGFADMWRGTLPVRVRVLPSELVYVIKDCIGRKRCSEVNTELDPRAASSRWRRFAQSFQYHYGADLVFGTIDAGLYAPYPQGPETGPVTNEWVRSHGVTFDLGVFLFRSLGGR